MTKYDFCTYIKDGVFMKFYKNSLPEDEESINLLTSLLVRYPELCTINFTPKGRLLKLSFILKDELKKDLYKKISDELVECVSTYLYFENKTEPNHFKINYTLGSGITVIEITRDANTLRQKEIALIISCLHANFKQIVVSNEPTFQADDLLEQDDFICDLLDNLRVKTPKNKLIAVREEGRVLVFKR